MNNNNGFNEFQSSYHYQQEDPSSKMKKGCCLGFLLALIIVVILGVAGYNYLKSKFEFNSSSEFSKLPELSSVISEDELSVETIYRDTVVEGTQIVEIKVTNNTDKYINNLPYSYYDKYSIGQGQLSIKPKDTGIVKTYIIDDYEANDFKDVTIKATDKEIGNYLSDKPLNDTIYLNDVKATITSVEDKLINFSISNSTNTEVRIDTTNIGFISTNPITNQTDYGEFVDVKNEGGIDYLEKIVLPASTTRNFVIVENGLTKKFDKNAQTTIFVDYANLYVKPKQ